jgi:iron complex outermembrane recepter protein
MQLNKITAACIMSLAVSHVAYAQKVSGVVADLSGKPVANAKVVVVNSSQSMTTNELGQFTFDNISKGEVELHVTAKAFSHNNYHLEVSDNDLTGVLVKMTPSVMEVIDVHATPLHSSNIESALPVNVIAADELRMKHASTLGETLKHEVGVHSTYYGPVSSSPIIRGLDGPRVLITQNGLDVGDASRVGPDHAVSSETATAQQVEVLRGPATLFYGSGAIGGVVNVVDNRVPMELNDGFDYMIKHNDVADENEGSFSLNTSSGNLAFHLDGLWRESNNYEIPGFSESESAHEEHEEEEDHDEHEEELGLEGTLLNSDAKSSGFTIGSSYILDNGFIGFSYGRTNREYGIVGHSHGHEEEHEGETEAEHDEHAEERVYADLKQDRIQLLSELNFDEGVINRVASKVAYTDYQHQEIEDGAVGTEFKNQLFEARFDAYHREYQGWKGAWTLHYKNTDFEALGEEAFTPPSETRSVALAWLEEKHFDDVLLQLGARLEHVQLDTSGTYEIAHHDEEEHDDHEHEEEHEEMHFDAQDFTAASASLGLVWDYQPGYNLGFSTSISQRAPSAAEIFSKGPHIGTGIFEVGAIYNVENEDGEVHFEMNDKSVDIETSYSLDITWRKFEGDFGFVVSAFVNHIDDYYYQQNTGLFFEDEHDHDHEEDHDEDHEALEDDHEEESEGLPIYVYQQNDVDMYGLEAEMVYQVTPNLKTTIFADYIKAKLSDGGNLPRIPPKRVGGQLNYQSENYSAELSFSHYFKQDDVAQLESKTDGYTIVDANVNYYLDGIGDDFVMFVKGNNLTNEEARVHASFLKDVAPLPGRGFEFGIRGSF